MPVKFRITLWFTLLVLGILLLVCGSVYYLSYRNRITDIQTRLTNSAVTTGRLLSESSVFDEGRLEKIDSATSLAMKDKVLEVYDSLGKKVYWYSDVPSDSLKIPKGLLLKAWARKKLYFTLGDKDAVACYYQCAGYGQIIIAAAYDEDGLIKQRRLRQVLLMSFIGGLLISITSGFLFSTSLLRPLRRISDEVNEISAGNLARRIQAAGQNEKDEWYYLAETLNQLLNRLQESFEIQAQFISNASHELSTPLTSISSQLEVSLQRQRSTGDYREVIQSVYQDVRQLNKLTQTLLAFARASGTAGGLEISPVRIDEILLGLPEEIGKLDKAYSVSLEFDQLPEQEEKLLVLGNSALLSTAIKNIVVNACKYSGDHHADVRLAVTSGEISITLSDTGRGIEEKDYEKIFQPFYRVDESHSAPGFGLGLSLAGRIIQLHKGSVSLRSTLGKGSVFTIQLPSIS
jgi:signal transduction histidine kinase